MRRLIVLLVLSTTVLLGALLAGCTAPPEPEGSPYAEWTGSGIRGLSPEEIEELRTGAGMGLARPAEVNGWPGPLHALELADELGLSGEQRRALAGLRADMLEEAVPLGESILASYGRIEEGFRDGSMDAARLRAELETMEALHGELRFVHLYTHLLAADVFTPEQRHEYMRLRGYADQGSGHEGHGGHGG